MARDMAPAAWAIGLAAWLAAHSCAGHAHAQSDDRFALALTQVTVHEAGFDSLADADGIHSVIVHGARRHGMSPVAFAHAYSPRLFAGQTRRAWVLGLRLSCERPPAFVGRWVRPRVSGGSRQAACVRLVAHARELVAGEPVCAADDWCARYHPLGTWLVATDCGDTLNLFAERRR